MSAEDYIREAEEFREQLKTMEFPTLSEERKLEIARLVKNEFVKGFQSKFKYIESLKDAEIWEDLCLLKQKKSGWYGWILISNQDFYKVKDRFPSYYIGYSYDFPEIMSIQDMKEITKLIKEV